MPECGHGEAEHGDRGEREASSALPFLDDYRLEHEKLRLFSADGVAIDALRLGSMAGRAVVICHGFGGNKNIAGLVACAEALASDFRVYTFDFRGHGLSSGEFTFTYKEADDLHAVVRAAKEEGNRKVGVIGFSMGGVVALRYAAERGGLNSLVAVSVPCRWEEAGAPGARLLRFLFLTSVGRALLGQRFGVRIAKDAEPPPSPAELLPRLGAQPLTIIAGSDDFIFEPEQARELHRLAGGRARLRVFERFGHAELGCGPVFFQYVKDVLEQDLL